MGQTKKGGGLNILYSGTPLQQFNLFSSDIVLWLLFMQSLIFICFFYYEDVVN